MSRTEDGEGPGQGVLVAGLGAEGRRDDAAGLEAARHLARRVPPGTEVRVLPGRAVDLLEAWAGAPLAVVVDAVLSGAAPGTLHRLDGLEAALPGPSRRRSTHDLGLAAVVRLGRSLGLLPARLVIVGIEAGEVSAGRGLSAPVRRGVRRAVQQVLCEIGEVPTVPSPDARRAVERAER